MSNGDMDKRKSSGDEVAHDGKEQASNPILAPAPTAWRRESASDSGSFNPLLIGLGRHLLRHGFLTIDFLAYRLRQAAGSRFHSQRLKRYEIEKGRDSDRDSDRIHVGLREYVMSERGDVPGWVLVVLMTTGLVTAIWAVAAPKLNAILKNSLDSMNNIR